MEDIWKGIEAWLAVNAPELLDSLKPGATEAEIQETESFLGVSLPEDVKAFYRIHDGQWAWYDKPELERYNSLYNLHRFLPLSRLREEWKIWLDVFENLEPEYQWVTLDRGETVPTWSQKFIPLTSDGCGDAYFLDMSAVLLGGNVGQIIENRKCNGLYPVASSFRVWVEMFVADLEAGRYWYDGKIIVVARYPDYRTTTSN
ncbi:MAG: SMI1/KNR4 family protein [Chroococcidiopsis sp.]